MKKKFQTSTQNTKPLHHNCPWMLLINIRSQLFHSPPCRLSCCCRGWHAHPGAALQRRQLGQPLRGHPLPRPQHGGAHHRLSGVLRFRWLQRRTAHPTLLSLPLPLIVGTDVSVAPVALRSSWVFLRDKRLLCSRQRNRYWTLLQCGEGGFMNLVIFFILLFRDWPLQRHEVYWNVCKRLLQEVSRT